nr:reverse transcriptase domain-containing protein [Tanacetum cinerariifolium]
FSTRRTPNVVEPELHTIIEMTDNRTIEELLQAPMKGDVPNDVIKLMMFPYSLDGNARVWYNKEPPNSVLTWEDLVNKFMNQFFPPSKTTHLKNEISRFTKRFKETFGEAWERFKEMLRACPHHEFTELAQIDTFYNALNDNDQDSLNAAAGGNLLSKNTREVFQITENKSKVRYSGNKPNVSRMNTTSRENASKTDYRIDKLTDQISTLVDIFAKKVVTPASVKAVEESCATCGGAHDYYNCPNTYSNQPSVCVATSTYNQVASQNRASNYMAPPGFALVQNSQNRLNDQKLREKATNQMENFFQIFHDLHFNISFEDALLLMPKFASTIKSLLTSKDKLFELAKIPLNENCSAMLLKNLPKKIGDPGKFFIPWRSFLRTGHALIDVYGEEITLRLNDEAITFNLNQTTRYSSTYDDLSEKCHFMVKEGIVLGHKISKNGLEVDRSKVDVIAKFPYPTTVKGVRSFLGHAGFYRQFIQDFSKIARPMTHLLEKETPFVYSKDCIDAF